MGSFRTISLKSQIHRLRDIVKNLNRIDESLSVTNISPGKKQSLLKERVLTMGKIKSIAKKIEDLSKGNIITISFRDNDTQEMFRVVYTNLSQEDAILHLKLMAEFRRQNITIIEVKEVNTSNSLYKL